MRDRLKTFVGHQAPDLQIRFFSLTRFSRAAVLPQPIGYLTLGGKSPNIEKLSD